ncbi:sensor histidine kinase [Vogesella sp. LIG4]|uniref:sensor histidine kinase n=1 Tax=Vogesella sp. LIG4 TaxID=1192162 RepID=UPI00081FB1FC|nr:HAMP domain-containing sensor histidine kinase [Vogesella sp. LIG4]SCK06275.1 Histidine kinase-, DNA gyrase B-, and HSP90-like ATPase [Vogesella sp. LIG4]
MRSIKTRLIIWIVLVLLLTLGITGYVSYSSTLGSEERDFAAQKEGLKQRLALSLPHGVWQLDDEFIRLTLDAELKSPIVVAMRVEGDAGLYLGRQRNAGGGLVNLPRGEQPASDETLSLPVIYQQRDNLGTVKVYLSRERIKQRLEREVLRQGGQALVISVVLSVILILLLRGYVFAPIHQLQRALQRAAELQGRDTPQLPEARYSEFSELVHRVNAIVYKISSELGLRRQAETTALEQKERAELAYRQLLDTQDTLIKVEKLASLGSLVAGVAHEINTPVGITLTAASHLALSTGQVRELFSSGQIRKSDLHDYLQDAQESSSLILNNAERAANLIHSFKQVAVDQTSEARREFELGDYLGEIITSLRPKLRRSQVQVEIDCPDALQMDSYPGALSQVVTNLVMNALTHAYDEDAEGTIRLQARLLADQRVSLQVCDDGKGIPPENMKHIFEPFFTTRRASGGSGLGLHIVFNIVFKRLGGVINVDSTLGKGTCFTLLLPCNAPQAKHEEQVV